MVEFKTYMCGICGFVYDEETGLPEEGIEAGRCIRELKAAGIPVVFGPLFIDPVGSRSRSGEYLRPAPGTPGLVMIAQYFIAGIS